MLFEFPVKTEEELSKVGLLDPDVYNFEVLNAQLGYSKSGNKQVRLILKVWDKDANEYTIYDYLVATERMLFKTKHFCESVGLPYVKGNFNVNDCVGKLGKVEISITKEKPNENGGTYPSKNSVKDYIPIDENSVESLRNGKVKVDSFINDSVPF